MEATDTNELITEILSAFKRLNSLSDKEKLLARLHDNLFSASFEDLEEHPVTAKDEAKESIKETTDIDAELEEAIKQAKITSAQKRNLENQKKGLLIIINNLKHYLGPSWQTIFPSGCQDVDRFLQKIDFAHIIGQDTWSRYENSPEKEKRDKEQQ